ncbi:hypothetical protein OIU34_20790 [Pararhizobium sp. BT-229]|uniref:hypothetical protein n=1 Tax=Pararhizobium sp. BT-229 TaxID=2986923 RepID=UPI0021F6EBF6|nr:hypothetical protein [Pararhizobium sp. BT-229]MCV9964328.1 hypothetical protein [Pararhizobium sp. BT-229]
MEIANWENPRGYESQRQLPKTLTVDDIRAALPGITELEPDTDGKSDHEFVFLADGVPCAVWRWKQTSWSAHGPEDVFVKLGLLQG